ncbi:MAG: hypothetical protein ACU0GG_13745 [Paracoccaceae bacterium]
MLDLFKHHQAFALQLLDLAVESSYHRSAGGIYNPLHQGFDLLFQSLCFTLKLLCHVFRFDAARFPSVPEHRHKHLEDSL